MMGCVCLMSRYACKMLRYVSTSRSGLTIAFVLAMVRTAQGQSRVEEVPNAMAIHTYFIILFTAAFLAWAVSFSLHTMKDRSLGRSHQALRSLREAVLDEITEVETAKESGELSEVEYKKRMKVLRGELSGLIEKVQSASKPRKKRA